MANALPARAGMIRARPVSIFEDLALPARAGMIPTATIVVRDEQRAPRASGDDPHSRGSPPTL